MPGDPVEQGGSLGEGMEFVASLMPDAVLGDSLWLAEVVCIRCCSTDQYLRVTKDRPPRKGVRVCTIGKAITMLVPSGHRLSVVARSQVASWPHYVGRMWVLSSRSGVSWFQHKACCKAGCNNIQPGGLQRGLGRVKVVYAQSRMWRSYPKEQTYKQTRRIRSGM